MDEPLTHADAAKILRGFVDSLAEPLAYLVAAIAQRVPDGAAIFDDIARVASDPELKENVIALQLLTKVAEHLRDLDRLH